MYSLKGQPHRASLVGKVEEYEPLCVPEVVELGFFLFLIGFQVQAGL